MKQRLTLLLILVAKITLAQQEPPTLLYSCEVKTKGKSQYYIMNAAGKPILKNPVDWAYSNAWTWLFVLNRKTNLITAYDYTGTPLGIDSIEETHSVHLSECRVAIKKHGKWGFYNRSGEMIIPHIYDEITSASKNKIAVKQNGDVFLIDTNGVRLNEKIDEAKYNFGDADIAIGPGGDFSHPRYKKISRNGKTGLWNVQKKKLIISAEYDDLVGIKDQFRQISAIKNKKYGLVSFDNQIIIPIQYESIFVQNDYF